MKYITFIVVALFVTKILWNLTVPYSLAMRLLRAKNDIAPSTSLMPLLEVMLLGIITGLSLFDNGPLWSWTTGQTLLVGGIIIVVSYVHFVVAGILAGWAVSKLRKRA